MCVDVFFSLKKIIQLHCNGKCANWLTLSTIYVPMFAYYFLFTICLGSMLLNSMSEQLSEFDKVESNEVIVLFTALLSSSGSS